jgi:hypothetical protein
VAAQPTVTAAVQTAIDNWTRRHRTTLGVSFGGPVLLAIALSWFTNISLTLTAVLLLMLLTHLGQKIVGIWWWLNQRRRVLAKASLPAPGVRAMLGDRMLERRRMNVVQKQWLAFCDVHGYRGVGKVTPRLYKPRSTVALDLEYRVSPGPIGVKGGVDKLSSLAPMLAEIVGCNEVLIRRTGVGHATLTFLWTEALDRVLPVRELPAAPKNGIAYGVRRDGSSAYIDAGLSVLIAGITGSGKSGLTWAILADLIRQDVHVNLYASDPKGGIELAPLGLKVGERQGKLLVADYCATADDTKRLIDECEQAMKERQAKQTGRKWTVADAAENPLIILLIDESVEVMALMKTAGPTNNRGLYLTKLKTIISQGRASGVMVLALTQMAQKEVVGEVRDMFAQRLSLAQKNAINTSMILGDQAEEMGALCSKIVNRPGLGYSFDESRRGFELFRGAWCDDDDITRIAQGLLPDGMDSTIGKAPANRQCAIYYFFTADGQSVYVWASASTRAAAAMSTPACRGSRRSGGGSTWTSRRRW